jgi:hypothetical protein
VASANRHDSLVLQDILEAVDRATGGHIGQHVCLEKAFVGASCDATARRRRRNAVERPK